MNTTTFLSCMIDEVDDMKVKCEIPLEAGVVGLMLKAGDLQNQTS